MSYVVYWLEEVEDLWGPVLTSRHKAFPANEMSQALSLCQNLRNVNMRHVTMSSENSDSVGKRGVDSIVDGKTPDGVPYTWMKRRSQ